jgi:hypothetical protein
MPSPVSATVIRTWSLCARERMRIVPRRPERSIACAALTIRLRKTWCSSAPWQTTGGSSPRSVATSATYL